MNNYGMYKPSMNQFKCGNANKKVEKSGSGSGSGHGTSPWVEKYRPRRIEQLIQHNRIKQVFQTIKKTGDMPHLLLFGPAGTGKTSSAFALTRELFGPTLSKHRVLELNASDSRGIKVVRNKISNFAKLHVGNPDPNYPSPPFKIIILDEADAMTQDAQAALRKIMESSINITRFILICNYDNKIMGALKSRCARFRFKPISRENCIRKLHNISLDENINITDDGLSLISKISSGDVRAAINILQNLTYLDKHQINEKDVATITSYVDSDIIDNIWKMAKTLDIKELHRETKTFVNKGYPIKHILPALCDKIEYDTDLNDIQRAKLYISISHCERRVMEKSSEMIQLLSVFAYLNGLINNTIDKNYKFETF